MQYILQIGSKYCPSKCVSATKLIVAIKGRKPNISIIFTRSFFVWADDEQILEQQAFQKKMLVPGIDHEASLQTIIPPQWPSIPLNVS